MKKILAIIIFCTPLITFGQSVAINNDASAPDNSALLDIKSTTKGLLIPRMSSAQRTGIASPALGLTVFDTNTFSNWIFRGIANGGWTQMVPGVSNTWTTVGPDIYNANAGNVGIGTPNPASKLTINDIDPVIAVMNNGLATGFLQAAGFDFKMQTAPDNPVGKIVLGTKGNDYMYISPLGKIGFGIADPVGKFQIATGDPASLSQHGYLMLGNENGINTVIDNNDILARSNGNHTNLYIQRLGGNVVMGDPISFNSSHKLGVDGNMVVTGGLRVGSTIGPGGYKLAVDGKIICTELMVRIVANWPDYVFNKDYKLRRLDDVESFIKKNNHLPGIPSAITMEKEGLNIGDMQKLQMEKIEELTLYIIDLKKEIDMLKAKK